MVWGTGPTLQARFRESGEHLVTLEALDTFGATSQDEVLVQVSIVELFGVPELSLNTSGVFDQPLVQGLLSQPFGSCTPGPGC